MNRTLALRRPPGRWAVIGLTGAAGVAGVVGCPTPDPGGCDATSEASFVLDSRSESSGALVHDRALDPRREAVDQRRGLLEHREVGVLGP